MPEPEHPFQGLSQLSHDEEGAAGGRSKRNKDKNAGRNCKESLGLARLMARLCRIHAAPFCCKSHCPISTSHRHRPSHSPFPTSECVKCARLDSDLAIPFHCRPQSSCSFYEFCFTALGGRQRGFIIRQEVEESPLTRAWHLVLGPLALGARTDLEALRRSGSSECSETGGLRV